MSVNPESAEQRRQNFEASAFALGLLNPDDTISINRLVKAIEGYNKSRGWIEFWEQGQNWESGYPWKAQNILGLIAKLTPTEDSLKGPTLAEQLQIHKSIRRLAAPNFRERLEDRLCSIMRIVAHTKKI